MKIEMKKNLKKLIVGTIFLTLNEKILTSVLEFFSPCTDEQFK